VVAQSAAVSACEKMGKWWLGDLESREWRFGRDVIFWHRDLGKIHGMEMKWGWKSWRGNRGCETFYPSWSMSLGNTPTSYIEEYNVGPPRSLSWVITPMSLWCMVLITIVTGANLYQLRTGGPHIVWKLSVVDIKPSTLHTWPSHENLHL
jgi:hypothetical protein